VTTSLRSTAPQREDSAIRARQSFGRPTRTWAPARGGDESADRAPGRQPARGLCHHGIAGRSPLLRAGSPRPGDHDHHTKDRCDAVGGADDCATSFYANTEIAYGRAEGVRSYYQFSSWTESPDLAVNAQLISRLERGSHFRAAVPAGSGIRGELLLTSTLDEIYHDATAPPGLSKLRLSAQLSNPMTRTLIARRTFDASAPAPSFDAAGAVQGFREALGQVLGQLTAWVNEYPSSEDVGPSARPGR
jgi:ABC-type uncharacterized transport system auxiliary subunit